ncbi:MAG TPA: hypothetical protein PLF42_00090, partial [Anaerolineales bacterium]|nr:hypothetical protein [Anaerolineales bacterium]
MKNQKDNRNGVLHKVREIIEEDPTIAVEEKEDLLKLLKVLMDSSRGNIDSEENENQVREFTQEAISKHSLIKLVKQQADELDALKRISLNLTSSLDLQTVLDAVVAEAMRLTRNAYAAHIFLYSHGILAFGASLNIHGERNKPISMPRAQGLTYLVAKDGEMIIVENMRNHP